MVGLVHVLETRVAVLVEAQLVVVVVGHVTLEQDPVRPGGGSLGVVHRASDLVLVGGGKVGKILV